jgi:hypothetical protein
MAAMNYRKLRIAWSVGWGVICLLLIVFWVRSYRGLEGSVCHWVPHKCIRTMSLLGEVGVAYSHDWENDDVALSKPLDWAGNPNYPYSGINGGGYPRLVGRMSPFKARFHFQRRLYDWYAGVPYWFLFVTTAIIGTTPWIPWSWRFSLRTMLVVSALITIALGAIMYTAT